jgi:VCBS repeat-containing protein
LAADGSYTYDPNGQFESLDTGETATDSFTYIVSDGDCSDQATVTVTITGVNDCPEASDDSNTTDEDSSVDGNVKTNDSDVDDMPDARSPGGSLGLVTLLTSGAYTYDPDGEFESLLDGETATDEFTYVLDDGDCTDIATVVILITGVNDAPTCADDMFTVLEGSTFESNVDLLMDAPGAASLLANDDDADTNDVLTTAKVSDPMWGTVTLATDGTFTYVHDDSENFMDSFMYRTTDLAGESCSATVTIFIQPVNRIRIDGQSDPVRENHWVTLDVAVESPDLQTLVFAIDYNHGTTRHLDYNYKVLRVGSDIPVNADILAIEDDSESSVTKLWVAIDGNTQSPQANPTVGAVSVAGNTIAEVVLRITMRVAIGSRLGDITPTVDLDSLLAYDANGMNISHTFINPPGLTPVIVDTHLNPLDGDENGFFDTVDASAYYRTSLWGQLGGFVPMVTPDLRASGLPVRASDKEIIANFNAAVAGDVGVDMNFDGTGPTGRSATDLTYLFRRTLALSAGLPASFTVPANHGLDAPTIATINDNIAAANMEVDDVFYPSLALANPVPMDLGPKGELDHSQAPIEICYNESLREPTIGILYSDATVNGSFITVFDNGPTDITGNVKVTIDDTARVLTITPIGPFTWPTGTITVIVDRAALLDVAQNLDTIGPADQIEVEAP